MALRGVLNSARRAIQIHANNYITPTSYFHLKSHHQNSLITRRNLSLSHCYLKNIKHKKNKVDNTHARTIAALRRQIIIAIKDGGGRDPAVNWRLAEAIKNSKNAGMSKTTMERALNVEDDMGETIVTLDCPEGIQMVVICGSSKISRCKHRVNKACSKYPWRVSNAHATEYFEHRVIVNAESSKKFNEDEAMELALEVGADDVEIGDQGELRFICDGKSFTQTEKQLKSREDIKVTSCDTDYVPYGKLPVHEEVFELYDKFLTNLDVIDSDPLQGFPILQVFHNLDKVKTNS